MQPYIQRLRVGPLKNENILQTKGHSSKITKLFASENFPFYSMYFQAPYTCQYMLSYNLYERTSPAGANVPFETTDLRVSPSILCYLPSNF